VIAAILLTWLWQGLLVALTALLLLRLLRHLGAATRHAVLWIALIITILIPGIAWVVLQPGSPATVLGTVDAGAVLDPLVIALPRPSPALMPLLLAVWAALLALRGVQIARGLRALARIKRAAQPLGATRERQLPLWRTARAAGRPCELRVSDEPTGVCAAGLRRPMILLPASVLRDLTSDELDQIVLHEHAHLLRYDDWLRLAQFVIAALFGLHPAVWLLNRHIDFAREAACDDHVVRITRAPQRYVTCLARVAELRLTGCGAPAIVPAATRSFRVLRARVVRLLNGTSERQSRPGWIAVPMTTVALTATLAIATSATPSIQFTESRISLADVGDGIAPARRLAPARRGETGAALVQRPAMSAVRDNGLTPARRLAPPPAPEAKAAPVQEPALTRAALLDAEPFGGMMAATPALRSGEVAADHGSVPSSRFDASTFAALGTTTAHAGRQLGGHLQQMGEGLGGWFAGRARAISKP
jgi:beta-lactamase regulating signal transducer with metallopeptidase domain